MFFPATTLVRGFNIRLHIDTQLGSHLGNLTYAQNLFVELPVKYMARTLGLIEELVKYGIPTMKVRYPTFLDTGQFTSYDPPDPFTTLTSDSIQFHFYRVVEMFEPIWKPYNVDIFLLQGANNLVDRNSLVITNLEWKPGWQCGSVMLFVPTRAGPASHHPLQQKLASNYDSETENVEFSSMIIVYFTSHKLFSPQAGQMATNGASFPWKSNEEKGACFDLRIGQFCWHWLSHSDQHLGYVFTMLSSIHATLTRVNNHTFYQWSFVFDKMSQIKREDFILKDCVRRGTIAILYHAVWSGSAAALTLLYSQPCSHDLILYFKQEVHVMKTLRRPTILLFMGAKISPQHVYVTETDTETWVLELMHFNEHDEILCDLVENISKFKCVVYWYTLFSGYFKSGYSNESLLPFMEMIAGQLVLDKATVALALLVCAYITRLDGVKELDEFKKIAVWMTLY
ncbi:putative non-specific serine/threonine protein kinase [Helianthus annuus]|nr:putative non-specific serine/threonine protein kinase [Helianthus annuus]